VPTAVSASSASDASATPADSGSSLAFTGNGPYARVLAVIGVLLMALGLGVRHRLVRRGRGS
jgi:type IV secretory pathway VirB2 component (pilin)